MGSFPYLAQPSAKTDPDWRTLQRVARFPDWRARLESYLANQSGRVYRYGVYDCALFVCSAVEAMTGVDPGREFRGKYLSRETARQRLQEAGGFAAVAQTYGMRQIDPKIALRGDVLQMKRFSLGLMSLNGTHAIVMGEYGLITVPALPAIAAWRV
jgi:hypothetical protein